VITQIKLIITHFDQHLTVEERNLISIAYKNLTNNLRNSWRIVDTLQQMQESRATKSKRQLELIRRQRFKIEMELADVCRDIVQLLDDQLLPASSQGEERVFYSKMYVSVRPAAQS